MNTHKFSVGDKIKLIDDKWMPVMNSPLTKNVAYKVSNVSDQQDIIQVDYYDIWLRNERFELYEEPIII